MLGKDAEPCRKLDDTGTTLTLRGNRQMPSYEFVCILCERRKVVRSTIAERDDNVPMCHGQPMERTISAPTVVYRAQGHTQGPSLLEKLGGES